MEKTQRRSTRTGSRRKVYRQTQDGKFTPARAKRASRSVDADRAAGRGVTLRSLGGKTVYPTNQLDREFLEMADDFVFGADEESSQKS